MKLRGQTSFGKLGAGMKYKWVTDQFYPDARSLRSVFQDRFAEPKVTSANRFVWDYWHVPQQYTLLRTPADSFFPATMYKKFLSHLGEWAWKNLGCSAISSPWLSYYISDCEQKWHSDVPHGPWAFVYSLSPDRLEFSGGETQIVRPSVLQYWNHFSGLQDREFHSFVDTIAPKFNRLVVFDPRLPHGVSRVGGIQDPRKARLVLHGWFTQPKPYLEGGLSPAEVRKKVNPRLDQLVEEMAEAGAWDGFLSLRLEVDPSGKIAKFKVLANTLWLTGEAPVSGKVVESRAAKLFQGLEFSAKREPSIITLPLQFS